jgi:antitoxin component YwqK of YwqJK toxin-antitoxin module
MEWLKYFIMSNGRDVEIETYPNKQIKILHTLRVMNGIKYKTEQRWYPDGKPQIVWNYINNKMYGLQQGWKKDGSLMYSQFI